MESLQKVVWAEGLFLGQQHFQRWDRYQDLVQALLVRSLNPLSWGFFGLKIDVSPLENGRFSVRQCQALFQDGRLIAYDAAVDPPLMCELGGQGGETLEIYLCLPANAQVLGISGYPGNSHLCGWQADYREIPDTYDATRNREVLLARPNLMLLTSQQSREVFVSLPVARVVNEGDGTYQLLSDFIPPLSRLCVSARLIGLLNDMVELVSGRLRTLRERRDACAGGVTEFLQTDPAHYHLLRILSGALPALRHFQKNPELHPELLFRQLVQILAELKALSAEDDSDLPEYRHDALDLVFPALFAQMQGLLHVQATNQSPAMVLRRETECLWSAEDVAVETFQRHTFFLEVDHPGDDSNWINDFVRQIKVGPRGMIDLMVASALPGVKLVHAQRPPARLSIRSGREYFRLEPRGDFWNAMLEEGSLAVFVSRPFADTKLSLVIVKE